MKDTSPISFIRVHLFGVSQEEFGQIAGASQTSVHRWESGASEPTRDKLQNIRKAAMGRRLPRKWRDEFFFKVPNGAAQ